VTVATLQYLPVPATESSRVPALDGLRGLAILLVLVGHTTPALAGYVGVELFFVLSGYLITGILLRAKGSPGYFRAFYARRALRIWPLYLLFLVALWTVWPLTPAQRGWMDLNGWWYWLHLANIGHAYAGNPPDHVTTHLWSLAVEEQFYLVWPAVIWWCSRRQAGLVCGVLIVVGMALRGGDPVPWLNTLTRLDSIAVGSLIALVGVQRLNPRRVGLAAALCLGAVLWLEPTLTPKHDPRWVVWLQTVLALGFGALLVSVVQRPPAWASWSWLQWLGRVSYCVYLVHLPLVVLLRPHVEPRLLPGAVAALSCGIAALSWRYWESPWLALRDRVPMPTRRPVSVTA
jgi:peptidoglycan/LPS O-acetylase OafA/YrhL